MPDISVGIVGGGASSGGTTPAQETTQNELLARCAAAGSPATPMVDPTAETQVKSSTAETVQATDSVTGGTLDGGICTVSNSETGNAAELDPDDGLTFNAVTMTPDQIAAVATNAGLSATNYVLGIMDLVSSLGGEDHNGEVLFNGMGLLDFDSEFKWDTTGKVLTLSGRLVLDTDVGAGQSNIAIGLDCLSSITDAWDNTAVGAGALAGLLTGDQNSAFGEAALMYEESGNDNVAVGFEALQLQVGIAGSVGLGAYSFSHNTNKSYNTGVGFGTGRYIISENNTAVGYNSLRGTEGETTVAATCNVAMGVSAGAAISAGYWNTLIGFEAGSGLKQGAANVAIGFQALRVGQASFGNVVIGQGSANYGSDFGNGNVLIGTEAMYNPGPSSYNVVIGDQAFKDSAQACTGAVVIGADSYRVGGYGLTGIVSVGYQAGRYATGNYNTILGYQALFGVNGQTTGEGNLALAFESLKAATTATNNCCGGHQTMNALTVGDNNCAWGCQAGIKATGDSNGNIFLGYMAGPSSAAAKDNSLYIHNAQGAPTIYGDLANKFVGFGGIEDPASAIDNAGATTHRAMAAPNSPASDRVVLYTTASGDTPTREVALYAKFQDGTAVKIASVLV